MVREGGVEPPIPCGTRPSFLRVCQFHHPRVRKRFYYITTRINIKRDLCFRIFSFFYLILHIPGKIAFIFSLQGAIPPVIGSNHFAAVFRAAAAFKRIIIVSISHGVIVGHFRAFLMSRVAAIKRCPCIPQLGLQLWLKSRRPPGPPSYRKPDKTRRPPWWHSRQYS